MLSSCHDCRIAPCSALSTPVDVAAQLKDPAATTKLDKYNFIHTQLHNVEKHVKVCFQ